jgi:superfamily II DNA/RNA helicase
MPPRYRTKPPKRSDKRTKRSRIAQRQAVLEQPSEVVLRMHINRIPAMPLTRLPSVVDLARSRTVVHLQEDVIRACLQRILSFEREGEEERVPRPEQVRTLRRLIFAQSDVLLIARTGFGKSLIFHAYSILTGKITIQLIPLTKLGDEQLADIRRFTGARPCLVDAKTRSEERHILDRIAAGHYTHVLLGPEQASSRPFRRILRETEFQARIGLLAIDECHLVLQWETFRPAFTLIGELRTILHQDVVWFGCSATLDRVGERRVLETAGFRTVGNRAYQTEIIRTSVDRPDIAIAVVPIPRGKLSSFDSLYFLLESAATDSVATPDRILKTIIFIDGRASVHQAVDWVVYQLIRLSSEYTTDAAAGSKCVFNVVRPFTAHVAQYDRDTAHEEFRTRSSCIRIMVATTSLGLGINFPDVDRIITWKFPLTKSLGDIWQRIGRGARGAGRTCQAYIMLPYWVFDSEGAYRPGTSRNTRKPALILRKKTRNQLPVDRAQLRSYLSQSTVPGDVSDTYTEGEGESQEASQPNTQSSTLSGGVPYWRKQEIEQRDKLPAIWLRVVNSSCHRRELLSDLGEDKLDPSERQSVSGSRCCSACNAAMLPNLIDPPPTDAPSTEPRVGTHAHFLLQRLLKFAEERANKLLCGRNARFVLPAGAYMLRRCRLDIVYALLQRLPEPCPTDVQVTCNAAYNAWCVKVPLLADWEWRETECDTLMQALSNIKKGALQDFMERQRPRASDREQASARVATPVLENSSLPLLVARQERDNTVAMEVAERAEQSTGTPPVLSTQHPQRRPLPLQEQTPSQVNKRPRRVALSPARKQLSRLDSAVDTTPKTQRPVLSFTSQSSRGRLRRLTSKGQENYK